MDVALTPDEQRAKVGQKVQALFSDNEATITSLMELTKSLQDTSGIESFKTGVPWKMRLAGGYYAFGNSLNLASAAEDIYAKLGELSITYPPETLLTLTIDPTRFRNIANRPPNSGGVNGRT